MHSDINIKKLRRDLKATVGGEDGLREEHLHQSDEDLIAEYIYVYGEEAIKPYLIPQTTKK